MIPAVQDLIKTLPLFTTLGQTPSFKDVSDRLRHRYKKFLICGLGGSILTTQALMPIAPLQNVTCLDNIDPLTLSRLREQDLSDTGIIFISKSGTTSEVLCQLAALDPAEAVVITQDQASPLYNLAQQKNWTLIPHPSDIGGRFSAFTPVGCLPCTLMGLDAQKFIEGAKEALNELEKTASEAKELYNAYQAGHALHVLWGYSDYLNGLLAWCCQLIAESLGKITADGQPFGFQPIINRGTIDQHSQLQLYLAGPHKYVFTLFRVSYDTIPIPRATDAVSDPSMTLYSKHCPNDFLNAYFQNTKHVLQEAGHYVREITLPDLSEKTFGLIMMRFILETLSLSVLAKVNPFDQPAVEDSKRFMERFL